MDEIEEFIKKIDSPENDYRIRLEYMEKRYRELSHTYERVIEKIFAVYKHSETVKRELNKLTERVYKLENPEKSTDDNIGSYGTA